MGIVGSITTARKGKNWAEALVDNESILDMLEEE